MESGRLASGLLPAGLAVTGIFILSVMPLLLGALGGGRLEAKAWHPVLLRIETAGGYLEPSTSRSRYNLAMLALGLFFFLVAGRIVWEGFGEVFDASPAAIGFFGLLGLMAAVLLTGGAIILRYREVNLRTEAVVTGLVTSTAMLFLLFAPLLLALVSPDMGQLERSYEAARSMAVERASVGSLNGELAVSSQVGGQTIIPLRTWAATIFLTPVLLLVFGAALFWYGILLSVYVWFSLERLSFYRGRGIYRQAVKTGRALGWMRVIFLSFWSLHSALIVAGFILLSLAILETLGAPIVMFQIAELSTGIAAMVLGRPFRDPWVGFAVRTGWVLYGMVAWACLAASVGQLWRTRKKVRQRLLASTLAETPERRKLLKVTAKLLENKTLPEVQLAVSARRSIEGHSFHFGLLRRERFVEVSCGALDRLDVEELSALVAHELAHHVRRHCFVEAMLRWLGRITFVGDGYVVALQDSFGYEAAADCTAVSAIGAQPEALLRMLQKARNVNRVIGRRLLFRGLPAVLVRAAPHVRRQQRFLRLELARLPAGVRWRLAWRLFRRQYFSPMAYHYWHPDHAERKAALLGMRERPDG